MRNWLKLAASWCLWIGILALCPANGSGPSASDPAEARRLIAEIKASGPYTDPGLREQSSWFTNVVERIEAMFERWSRNRRDGAQDLEGMDSPVWFWVAFALLGVSLGAFLFLVVRHSGRTQIAAQRVGGLLSPDEQDVPLDEWLARAQWYDEQGDTRLAVRSYYIAGLMELDRRQVLRFEPSETNWEHVRRYQRLDPTDPVHIIEVTVRFDQVWYGRNHNGSRDVDLFRRFHESCQERAGP